MRLIDADKLPINRVGKIEIVLLDDIKKAKSYELKTIKLAPEKSIEIRWLQQRIMDAILDSSDQHMDSKYFGMINRFIAEYQEEHHVDD